MLRDINRIEEDRAEDLPVDIEILPQYRSHSVVEESNPLNNAGYDQIVNTDQHSEASTSR